MGELARLADQSERAALHPAIEFALDAYDAGTAAAARAVIRALLSERLARDGMGAWDGSRLTGDGFPFELAVDTQDERLRFTVEPGAAALDPRRRLALAIARTSEAGAIPPAMAEALASLQIAGPLAYGAWIGARVGEHGVAYKIYAEAPPHACAGAPLAMEAPPSAILRVLAYAPGSGEAEHYFRVATPDSEGLCALLRIASLEHCAPWLWEFVESAAGRSFAARLPGTSVGISYAGPPARRKATLFLYAGALWGADADIRIGFARVADALGWDAARYLRITAPLCANLSWRTRHGMLGVRFDAAMQPSLSLGVRVVAP